VLLGMSPRFIHVRVKDVESNSWNRISFVYGGFETAKGYH
jgi:hypothetical protein